MCHSSSLPLPLSSGGSKGEVLSHCAAAAAASMASSVFLGRQLRWSIEIAPPASSGSWELDSTSTNPYAAAPRLTYWVSHLTSTPLGCCAGAALRCRAKQQHRSEGAGVPRCRELDPLARPHNNASSEEKHATREQAEVTNAGRNKALELIVAPSPSQAFPRENCELGHIAAIIITAIVRCGGY